MTYNRNILTFRLQMIKQVTKELHNTKLYAVFLISVMLVGIFSLCSVISSLMDGVIIRSTGRIGTAAPIAYKSEIRGVFIHEVVFGYPHDWNVIAETLAGYGIDAVYAHFSNGASRRPDAEWVNAINAFHSRGIEFHVCIGAPLDPPYNASTRLINHLGEPYSSGNCPSNSIYRTAVKENVEYIASNYDIDGVMYDYIRYDIADQCYCPVCRARFEEWLGEGTITDWTPFYTNGARWLEYAEWRNIPITELVRDVRSWMLAIKPNLVFSLAAWTYFQDCPIYWRKWLGQDTGAWIKEGYLDMVAPMMYGNDLTALGANCDANLKYMTGGTEGKIPLVAFLNNDDRTPEEFKAQVDVIRSKGLDGWIIWRYGGPGVDGPFPDIRNYLSIIDMHAFALQDIGVSTSGAVATITWLTDLPATSKVEYSSTQLFNASWELWRGDFYYWGINHINGTVIEDETLVTIHNMTITGLSPGTQYYFRVQSQDSSGIASSTVSIFATT